MNRPANITRLVEADRKTVHVRVERLDGLDKAGNSHSTVLGDLVFNRQTAEMQVTWDFRENVPFLWKVQEIFRFLKFVKSL